MSGLTTLALREQSAYQRDEIDSLKARVRLLETQELPFVSRLRIDAKGDLFAGTADNAYARLPVGSNGDLLIADSTQTTGLRWGAATAAVISDFAEAAQDAVGAALLDSATIDFTYNDGAGTITAIVIDDSISNAKLRNSVALSVIGRSANSTGDPGDISATAGSGAVLREAGGTLGFGQVATAGIADAAIINAKLANMTQATVKGRPAGAGTGAPSDLSASQLNAIIGTANLGIGVSPAAPLHIRGSEALRVQGTGTPGAASIGYLSFYDSDGSTRYGFVGDASSGSVDIFLRADIGALQLGAGGATTVTLDTNGRVGIGVSVPDSALQIAATDPSIRLTQTGSSQSPFLAFYESGTLYGYVQMRGSATASPNLMRITAQQAGGEIALLTGANERMRIDSSGRVGIGISTPATTAKLHVEQGASPGAEEIARFTVSDDSTGLLRIVNTTTSDGLFNPGIETLQAGTGVGRLDLVRLTTDSGTTPGLIIDVRSAAGTAITTRPLVDYRSSGASRMIILGNGNIGIATTSPQALLHVGAGTDAPDTSNVNIYATNAGTTAIAARNSTGNIEVFMLAGTSSALIGTITNHPLFLRTNNTNHVFLQVDGTMGIRTSSPSATLSIKAGESTDHANVGGIIHVNTTAAGNVGSGEQDLMTFSVPANTLAVNGDSIWFEISAHIASSLSTSKIIRIRFGNSGTNLVHTTNDINSTTTGHVVIRGRIVRTGSSSQISYANNNARANAVNPYFTTIETGLNQTLSSTVTFRVTGQATNNDDIIIQSLVIGWDPVNT